MNKLQTQMKKYYNIIKYAELKLKEKAEIDTKLKEKQSSINQVLESLEDYKSYIKQVRKNELFVTIKELIKYTIGAILIFGFGLAIYGLSYLNVLLLINKIAFPIGGLMIIFSQVISYYEKTSFYKKFYKENISKKDELQKEFKLLEKEILINQIAMLSVLKQKNTSEEILKKLELKEKQMLKENPIQELVIEKASSRTLKK